MTEFVLIHSVYVLIHSSLCVDTFEFVLIHSIYVLIHSVYVLIHSSVVAGQNWKKRPELSIHTVKEEPDMLDTDVLVSELFLFSLFSYLVSQ